MMRSARWRLLLLLIIAFVFLIGILWFINSRRTKRHEMPDVNDKPTNASSSSSPTSTATASQLSTPSVTPEQTGLPIPIPTASPPPVTDGPTPNPQNSTPGFIGELKLIIPVAGVKAGQLVDTFADARSEGRVHDAIDIPAQQGTPVLAAADGKIIKLFQSERGGTTIYQLSVDNKLVYYYAHLQRYAEGISEGQPVRQGQVIAYVGDTGNAGAGNYHLHFSIAVLADPKRYWEGTNIDPYPILHHD